jgi:hypothetical protein
MRDHEIDLRMQEYGGGYHTVWIVDILRFSVGTQSLQSTPPGIAADSKYINGHRGYDRPIR